MARIITEREVLKRFKEVHGDKYDYSFMGYVNMSTKVSIICKKHGVFKQSPHKHYSGQKCPKCSGKNRTNEDFIRDCSIKHNNKYNYSLTKFTKNVNNIIIICPVHGEFTQVASSHLHGSGCIKCAGVLQKNTNEFLISARKTHRDRYDYSKSNYVNGKSTVEIICKKHGSFWQSPINHCKGVNCPKCSYEESFLDTEFFIKKSKETHGERYDYSKSIYVRSNQKVNIICKDHGLFKQSARSHWNGSGCHKCARISIAKYSKENPTGWSTDNWDKKSNQSKNFDSFKVYIIKCYNDNEVFYKIGRTFTTVKKRFENKKINMPYKYEVIKEFIFETAKEAFDYENKLKREYKKFKYSPNIYFKGCHECFDISLSPTLILTIKNGL